MNILTMGISAVFAVVAAVFTAWLLMAILDNLKTGRHYRQALDTRLSRLRLSNMLSYKGIDQSAYLHTQQMVDIEQQMKRCGSCAQTGRCDSVIAGGDDTTTEFCANDVDLKSIRRQLDPAA